MAAHRYDAHSSTISAQYSSQPSCKKSPRKGKVALFVIASRFQFVSTKICADSRDMFSIWEDRQAGVAFAGCMTL